MKKEVKIPLIVIGIILTLWFVVFAVKANMNEARIHTYIETLEIISNTTELYFDDLVFDSKGDFSVLKTLEKDTYEIEGLARENPARSRDLMHYFNTTLEHTRYDIETAKKYVIKKELINSGFEPSWEDVNEVLQQWEAEYLLNLN